MSAGVYRVGRSAPTRMEPYAVFEFGCTAYEIEIGPLR